MIRHFSFAIVAAAVAATSLAAQAPSGSTPSSTTPSASASASATTADRVTVTGCIERADQIASSATNPTADPDSLQYVLVRAGEAGNSSAAPAPTGTTGTAGGGAESRVMYRLSGDQQKLNPHVGHKVEIVGTPSTMASSAAASPASGATASMPSGPAPGLTVENVRMLDATCSAK